ncbi:uncharacterized protein CANTADRAFT_57044 [Suhomyces tanzawaensis NRRL Y-17324]|uniref:Golgi apyrase n=1 Tax=Suhomyces tanzawaensis NRRL Y-17324 TaxID=984487 RepID=A0A1E4SC34_9ASCO|nr:uncharacterized protein CANTADRAFT_57044 [Suhomyces tanzawaensis NRRL Y-17324]ODV77063.1 hypothetical protein CANTADRAFT_57044 [Suhomyces tanzawaensis NRRL Y-17324]
MGSTQPVEPRKKKPKTKPGPLYYQDDTIPYDYIVIVDAGSKGSRVYVYNWINPTYALQNGLDFKASIRPASSGLDVPDPVRLPKVASHKKWHRKIVPGISSFSESPQKIGKHHLKDILQLASAVVPKSQHHRTPIFVHSTAGMRLLTPTGQQEILDSICSYITGNSDFYLPECSTHINVLTGDVEGLYGWLSINYMNGALDHPDQHQHGKNHTTYGLLDMGGASTQVVFQPNSTETDEHRNFLYKIKLRQMPVKSTDSTSEPVQPSQDGPTVGHYTLPESTHFDVFSDSFLGFGMYQAHNRYLSSLVSEYKNEHGIHDENGHTSRLRSPVPDPCLPIGYTTSIKINDVTFDFTGASNFLTCMQKIFPILLHNDHTTEDSSCKQFSEDNQVSTCLLNDLIPAFDFDVNHFIAVSGYWDAITNLLSYETGEAPGKKDPEDTYDYALIYQETTKVCSKSFISLMQLNDAKKDKYKLEEHELAELCFKSSWILNFLHLGLGFPRFGIDERPNKDNKFKSLQLVEELEGSSFSWTLGRAILYANDEYIQAFNNYTIKEMNLSEEEQNPNYENSVLLERPGFFHTASPNVYKFGAEQDGIAPRPQFVKPRGDEKYHFFDYENQYSSSNGELVWNIKPHRWYGIFIFMFLSGIIVWLMVGTDGRRVLFSSLRLRVAKASQAVQKLVGRGSTTQYTRVGTTGADIEAAEYELDDVPVEGSSQFQIDSDGE